MSQGYPFDRYSYSQHEQCEQHEQYVHPQYGHPVHQGFDSHVYPEDEYSRRKERYFGHGRPSSVPNQANIDPFYDQSNRAQLLVHGYPPQDLPQQEEIREEEAPPVPPPKLTEKTRLATTKQGWIEFASCAGTPQWVQKIGVKEYCTSSLVCLDGSPSRVNMFEEERILRQLNAGHPIIPQIQPGVIVTFENGDTIGFGMEYCGNQTLDEVRDVLETQSRLYDSIRGIFVQLVSGVAWMHSQSICHRDLCMKNIVCQMTEKNEVQLKVVDFGSAREFFHGNFRCEGGKCGTENYMAPEVFDGKPYDARAADIWSLGRILVELYAGVSVNLVPHHIPENTDDSWRRILGDVAWAEMNGSNGCIELVKQIFVCEENRINMAGILNNSFVRRDGEEVICFHSEDEKENELRVVSRFESLRQIVRSRDLHQFIPWIEEEVYQRGRSEMDLFEDENDPIMSSFSLMTYLCYKGWIQAIDYIFRTYSIVCSYWCCGYEEGDEMRNPIIIAAASGHLNVVRYLSRLLCTVDSRTMYGADFIATVLNHAFQSARFRWHHDICRHILRRLGHRHVTYDDLGDPLTINDMNGKLTHWGTAQGRADREWIENCQNRLINAAQNMFSLDESAECVQEWRQQRELMEQWMNRTITRIQHDRNIKVDSVKSEGSRMATLRYLARQTHDKLMNEKALNEIRAMSFAHDAKRFENKEDFFQTIKFGIYKWYPLFVVLQNRLREFGMDFAAKTKACMDGIRDSGPKSLVRILEKAILVKDRKSEVPKFAKVFDICRLTVTYASWDDIAKAMKYLLELDKHQRIELKRLKCPHLNDNDFAAISRPEVVVLFAFKNYGDMVLELVLDLYWFTEVDRTVTKDNQNFPYRNYVRDVSYRLENEMPKQPVVGHRIQERYRSREN